MFCRPLYLQSKRGKCKCMFVFARHLFARYTTKNSLASSVKLKLTCVNSIKSVAISIMCSTEFHREKRKKTYLCFTVMTVSDATLVVMFFAATSKPVHMVANPVSEHIEIHT